MNEEKKPDQFINLFESEPTIIPANTLKVGDIIHVETEETIEIGDHVGVGSTEEIQTAGGELEIKPGEEDILSGDNEEDVVIQKVIEPVERACSKCWFFKRKGSAQLKYKFKIYPEDYCGLNNEPTPVARTCESFMSDT